MKDKLISTLSFAGFGWCVPVIRLTTGEDPNEQIRQIFLTIGVPVLTFGLFLLLWNGAASGVRTNLGTVPGPAQVVEQIRSLAQEHREERQKRTEFYARQAEKNKAQLAANPTEAVKVRKFTGRPTYLDQIFTSLRTVFTGFLIASLIAVPLGILCGMSKTLMTALNPLIQIFKPVSPVAWLPIVTMIVSAVYVVPREWMPKSYVISSITVALCCMWPSLINTAIGVKSIDKDYINVGRVLRLGFFSRVFRIVLPVSMPYIFAGLRISLGVGWVVLIASEMLSQNPGLGKFVWDEFQNGSSQSLARIMVAAFTIGLVGFVLDRIMIMLHQLVSYGQETH
jgi:nitrate/nitrite transport system permease protein